MSAVKTHYAARVRLVVEAPEEFDDTVAEKLRSFLLTYPGVFAVDVQVEVLSQGQSMETRVSMAGGRE